MNNRNITLSLLLMVFMLFAANSIFALKNGRLFDNLPYLDYDNSIDKFAQATVGLQMYDLQNNTFRNCTGIRISPNAIMTAAHCLVGMPDHIKITGYNSLNETWQTYLYPKDFTFVVPQLFKDYKDQDKYALEFMSVDIGVIRVDKSIDAFSEPYFIDVRKPRQVVTTINDLNNYMFNPTTKLYVFSWGSRMQFEYITRLNPVEINSNSAILDKQSDHFTTDSWSYLLAKFDEYEQLDYFRQFTFNALNNSYLYNDNNWLYWELYPGEATGIFTNTNILFLTTKVDKFGEAIVVEGGDSGGPLVACEEVGGGVINCSLIGITAGQGTDNLGFDLPARFVTTANTITQNFLLHY